VVPAVAWGTLKQRVAAEVDRVGATPGEHAVGEHAVGEDARGDDASLDETLRSLPGVEHSVEWAEFHRRVAQAIDTRVAKPTILRRLGWRVPTVAGMLAAAAAVVLMLSSPSIQPIRLAPSAAAGSVFMAVLPPGGAPAVNFTGRSVARVAVIADPDLDAAVRAEAQAAASAEPSEPEVYFIMEPPDPLLAMVPAGRLVSR
jgi:hypothetical protein